MAVSACRVPAELPSRASDLLRSVVAWLDRGARPRHRARWRHLSQERARQLSEATRRHYTNFQDEGDFDASYAARIDANRRLVVPWIDAAFPLDGAKVLEIGSGTGESTLALAEQGARITAVDVDQGSLEVGRTCLQLHGLDAEFLCANANALKGHLAGRQFDAVIFSASLEHMTLDERLRSIADTWDMTRGGGIWCVNEAPNRLWYDDGHTSNENFYNWLPDELASRWAHRSSRKAFAQVFPTNNEHDALALARWGRGVSYHELEVVLGDVRRLDVVSGKGDFTVGANILRSTLNAFRSARAYERFLERLEPEVHSAFFRAYMDVIIRKH